MYPEFESNLALLHFIVEYCITMLHHCDLYAALFPVTFYELVYKFWECHHEIKNNLLYQ